MYAACTLRLSQVVNAAFAKANPRGFVVVALAAWLVVMIGFLRTTANNVKTTFVSSRRAGM